MATLLKLNNGLKLPQVGLGVWKIPNELTAETVYNAIKQGYRLFDGAEDYGNEKEVGQGVRRAIDEGLVKREDLFIVSKLWNNYHHPDNVGKALDRTLSDLGLDYLDLFYIHFPIAFKFVPLEEKYPPAFYCGDGNNFHYEDVPLLDTYRALERLVDAGRIKSLGVSNFNGALLQDLLRGARIKPVALQIEHHPYLVQQKLIEYAQSEDIVVVAYSSFGPQSFLELKVNKALTAVSLFEHDVIKKIAQAHNRSAGEVLLRWATQRGLAIIPKSSKPERLSSNLHINSFDLTKEDLETISSLDLGLRFNDPWDWDKIPIFA
ncbi:Aldose reductase [Komagataella phaffii CBS 7435]|uniref:Aldose reductase involved in methylglyoxal, d-xylose and arabinose metabolism n=2 Tax=Komagataella phaffii TaxID=460519 RepID=C4R5F8_KOMPG|nr:Aldose reductase involved in methylglyoxal, d-xylose and arabinose metabolism [Komagataella phaffii GS115]AOA63609.1 GQ67_03842T0 [Komagataella phaffii]KAI0463541.1 hypothetical protein LJB42_002541 [Komagataella kurtzmanii]CAH2449422.1 Aldose reductase [Komagataella phaffii CBS 7435]AOA68388.1 GQ68_03815T0 [Komagataella phaffii GS115]CAY70794.1 Aldose reductase involved in methylglyoxal, d-xylose and arabinose metabolism [Komagataella phaffii GS115]